MDLRTALKNGKSLSIIFVISAALSLVAITPEIVNHVEFYKALAIKLNLEVKNLAICAPKRCV